MRMPGAYKLEARGARPLKVSFELRQARWPKLESCGRCARSRRLWRGKHHGDTAKLEIEPAVDVAARLVRQVSAPMSRKRVVDAGRDSNLPTGAVFRVYNVKGSNRCPSPAEGSAAFRKRIQT